MPVLKLAGDRRKPNQISYSSAGLIIKLQDSRAIEAGKNLIEVLLEKLPKLQISVEEAALTQFPKSLRKKLSKKSLHSMANKLELIIVVGGDGTLLRCARYLLTGNAWKTCALLGINAGRVGFLSSMNSIDAQKKLPRLLANRSELGVEERMCLKVKVQGKKKNSKTYHVLNDCVLSKGSLSRIFEFRVDINQEVLSLYRADGLIISPPTGSTAYNLAAGGSIVEPVIPAIQLTPIAPQSFSNKPILISDKNKIRLYLGRHTTDIFLTLDGHTGIRIDDDDLIEITKSEKFIQFLIPKSKLQSHFFHSLRQKLNWGIVPKTTT